MHLQIRSRNLFAALIALTASAFASGADAAPVVSGVTGMIANGQSITVKGSGFGSGPNVVIFDDCEKGNGKTGDAIPLTSPEVGQWTQYGWSCGRPRYHAFANSGAHGWAVRDWGCVQYPKDDNNRLGQFRKSFDSNVSEVFIAFEAGVPPGTPFAGASSPATWPNVSSWKFAWLMDGADGFASDGHADMCVPTQVGYGDSGRWVPSSSSRTGRPADGFFCRNSGFRLSPDTMFTCSMGSERPFSAR